MQKNNSSNTIVFLMGPTASGKSSLALSLVKRYPLEIISVDSALVYKGMDIGTAKPSKAEQAQVPHHLIDLLDPSERYSAAQFRNEALQCIEQILQKGKLPLLVGGTMLYFKALQQGLSNLPQADDDIRQQLQQRQESEGLAALHQDLAQLDPAAAQRIHQNDPQRVLRALEVYYASQNQQSLTSLQDNKQACPYPILSIGLIPSDRAQLHQRIAQRFEQMMTDGFIAEARQLYERGDLKADLPSMRSVGYRQAWQYFDGVLESEAEMVEKAIIATRQLAKRQLTWLRSWPELNIVDPLDAECEEMVCCLLNPLGANEDNN